MALKLKSISVVLIALSLAGKVSANADDLKPLKLVTDTKNSMIWPMLPGESLSELAIKFYPNSQFMQRQFVFKTQYLSKESLPDLKPNDHFSAPTALVIPTLRSLSSNAGTIKKSHKSSGKATFRLTNNIQSSIKRLPKSLFQDYENLLVRNDFLKVELAKLNEKLDFLKNKLSDLKLILDRTLTLPTKRVKLTKKVFKNLDAEKVKKKVIKNPAVTVQSATKSQETDFFRFSNILLWLGILALGVLIFLGSYLLKKYRERKYIKFLDMVTQQEALTSFSFDTPETELKVEGVQTTDSLSADTQIEETSAGSVLEEAKVRLVENSPEEAIEYLKLAIKEKPKLGINIWLYLLSLLKEQSLKDDFEKLSFQMHQTFNVMTPLWGPKEVAIVVPKSLEEFPHIVTALTEKWPDKKLIKYLHHLILDNRDGERSGFAQEVIEEILLLIAMLEDQTSDSS